MAPEHSATPPLTPFSFRILLALSDGEKHGYGIIKEIEAVSSGTIRLGAGTLYTAIRRLEDDGFIAECRGSSSPAHERRRYYRITPSGKRAASAEAARLSALLEIARAKLVVPLDSRLAGRKA